MCLFFLTGCAVREYHIPLSPAATDRGAELSALPPFQWPLKGRVVLPFGAQEDGVSLKGIVLEAADGAAVVAAGSGRVVVADERLQGYGKTLILEHSAEFSTIYARNSEILVKPGQRVLRGQPIAKVGRGGKGNIPRLYFEVRKKSEAQDPLTYLSYKNF